MSLPADKGGKARAEPQLEDRASSSQDRRRSIAVTARDKAYKVRGWPYNRSIPAVAASSTPRPASELRPTMSTPQPPGRDQPPADPNRHWVQQTDAPPSSTSSLSGQPQPQAQPGDGRPRRPTITEAAQSIKPNDFLTFHQAPCARTGLLTGIGAGAAVGGIRWIMGLAIPRAANWAVGAGALGAIAQYEYCQLKRMQEREKVKRVVEVYAAKQAREKREKYEEEKRERERLVKEEEGRKGWWRFW